jgi:hypothetical protein
MNDIADLQQELLSSALLINNKAIAKIKPFGNIDARDKFQIHIDTIMVNLVNALQISFPGIWQLLGDDCAKGAGLSYSHDKKHLVKRSNINLFGEKFPEFLSQFETTKNIVYLKDFAQMEWLRSLCYEAKKTTIISPAELQSIAPDQLENTKFVFNHSMQMMKSQFPLDEIQDILDNPNPSSSLQLSKKTSYILICRIDNKVSTFFLDQFSWEFISLLKQGLSLGDAIEVQSDQENIPDLSNLFALMLRSQLIVKLI